MIAHTLSVRRVALIGALLTLVPVSGRAEVTRVEVQRREDVLGGKSFGSVGPYEKIVGKVYFAVDPSSPHNKIIADLDKAPKNPQGKVEFSSDLYIIKPKDPSRGNGVVFFDIVNRGNKQLLGSFSRGGRTPDPTAEADFGDAHLLRQGYTLVAVGWQFDVARGRGLVGFDAPIATDSGRAITGWVKMWFISDKPVQSVAYVGGYNTSTYSPLDPSDRQYRLTEREGIIASSRLIPRDDWQFARGENGKVVPDPKSIHLKSFFKAGLTYEVAFETKDPPVAGLGMAAIRDMASALKYGANAIAPGRYAYMYGASQTGRLIRQIVHDGFTIDEQGRQAFDAAFVQTGATGVGSFNERFAQPNELGSFSQTKFPFLYRTTTDPITGRQDGLGARIPAGLEPKLMLVDTASEYWDRGRVAALRHTSLDGSDDIDDASNVRVYTLAGAKHGAGSFPPVDNGGQFKENSNDYRWAQRGLLAALDAWVRQGTEPPASRHPRWADGSLVAQSRIKFPAIPGVQWPTSVPGGYRADVLAPYSALPFLVPKVDADGNDLGGIRLPELAVPLATLTGWQFRSERIGAPDVLIAMAGAYIPLPKTKAEAVRLHDPRTPIAERYLTRTGYLQKVQESASRLARERYILQEDVPALVQDAGQHWDVVMAAAPATTAAGNGSAVLASSALAQQGGHNVRGMAERRTPRLAPRGGAQSPSAARSVDWPLHNLDLAGSRFSPLDQINRSNVKSLTPRWLFQHGVIDGVSNQTTPVIVDGTMYVTDSRGSVYAVDAAGGHLLWTYDVTKLLGGGAPAGYVFRNRGVCYADGVVYAAAGSFLFALDAKTGKPIPGFGKDGQASVILDVLRLRYPDVKTAISLGYWFTTAPQVHNGVLYIGSTRSESHIPGGHVLAVDAKTGKVLWHFNTVPQDEHDQAWAVAGPTWVGGERNGGGIWETPSLDPELGLLYVAVGNPFGDSSKRKGINLFTDSIVALTLRTGELKWYYQQTHHDVWDYDSGGPPILFDMQVRGQRVKALAEASKNGYLYILNRETGQPVHAIKETPVPTQTERPGEEPWPTQPIPHTALGKPMSPVSPVFPLDIPPDRLAKRKLVPAFTPQGPNQIIAPGTGGGANYGPISYSPQTGLLYVAAIDSPFDAGRPAMGYFSAFDPTTGELAWQQKFEGYAQAGSLATAGGLVFVGSGSNIAGYFFAYDAKTGELLWKFNTGSGVFSSPAVYMVNGEEFVTVGSGGGERGRRGGDLILSFALPKP